MLGLGGSITNRAKPPVFDFRKIKGLIGWWDFSNKGSITDVSSNPIDNGDYIYQIKNLAFDEAPMHQIGQYGQVMATQLLPLMMYYKQLQPLEL
mgnify:CR=1 FL=1